MKMVIDGSRTMNVVVKSAVRRCHLNIEPHPHTFKVAWVNKTALTITHRCKVPF